MKYKTVWIQKSVLAGAYVYLALPAVLFFAGWCRWQVGIPLAVAVVCAAGLCLKEHCRGESPFLDTQAAVYRGNKPWGRMLLILGIVLAWTWLSGVGGYAWQNTDHPIRNEIFQLLMDEAWPVERQLDGAPRGLVYYLGYWLLAAGIGKLCGPKAGWAAQYIWAVAGIILMYALFCICRKKLSVWPLLAIIAFSGLDMAGMLLRNPDQFRIFGTLSLDEWFGYYQFSSMTTQLFWVFNQAVPAWVLCMLVFLGEKPKNVVFITSLIILTSTFPFAGMIPYVLYVLATRCAYQLESCLSLQNLTGVAVAAVSLLYIAGNGAVKGSLPAMPFGEALLLCSLGAVVLARLGKAFVHLQASGRDRQTTRTSGQGRQATVRPGSVWKKTAVLAGILAVAARICQISGQMHPLRYFAYLLIFYLLEAGLLLAVVYPSVEDKKLFVLTAAWLFIIPLILVGNSSDFCMRASIPGLFLLMLWCIEACSKWHKNKQKVRFCLLVVFLLAGALTPLHEMTRSIVHTKNGFENQTATAESVLSGNNFSGAAEGFFWEYLAKRPDAAARR